MFKKGIKTHTHIQAALNSSLNVTTTKKLKKKNIQTNTQESDEESRRHVHCPSPCEKDTTITHELPLLSVPLPAASPMIQSPSVHPLPTSQRAAAFTSRPPALPVQYSLYTPQPQCLTLKQADVLMRWNERKRTARNLHQQNEQFTACTSRTTSS